MTGVKPCFKTIGGAGRAQGPKPSPLESQEQRALFEWARLAERKIPELRLLHAIPNGEFRRPATARALKAQGVKAGVPDICLPVARKGFNGLYVELKRAKGGRVSPEQAEWIELLRAQGYKAEVCRGFDGAKAEIERYLL